MIFFILSSIQAASAGAVGAVKIGLANDIVRSALALGVDLGNILPHNAHTEELNAADEQYDTDERRPARDRAAVENGTEEDEKERDLCYQLGYRLGRYIYLIDVIDDYHDDVKKGAYNPLIASGFSEDQLDYTVASLARENYEASAALDALEISYSDINNILKNILELGLPSVLNKILEKKFGKDPTDS